MTITSAQLQLANRVALAFDFTTILCDLIIILVFALAPTSYGLRKYFSRMVVYLAVTDLLWALGSGIQYIRYEMGITPETDHGYCNVLGDTSGYFKVYYTLWDTFIAITMYMKIVRNRSTKSYEKIVAIGIGIYICILMIVTGVSFPMGSIGTFCFIGGSKAVLGQQILYFSHVYLSLVVIIMAYFATILHIGRLYMAIGRGKTDTNIHGRAIVQLMLFPFVTLIIWVPALGRSAYQINHPTSISALLVWNVTSTLAGPLNLLIWGGTRKIWRAFQKGAVNHDSEDTSSCKTSGKDNMDQMSKGASKPEIFQ